VPGSNELHVASISVSVVNDGPNRFHAEALVTIHNENNQPASSATVNATFSGDTNETTNGLTNASGQVTLSSSIARFGANWTLCVDSVTKSGFTSNAGANVETCDSTGGNPTPTPGPTATPVPPTPTPVPGGSMHVGDLDGTGNDLGNKWNATVVFTVHDGNENPVAGAVVSGSWTSGTSGNGSCVTNASGQCSVTSSNLRNNTASATFTVTNVSHGSLTYQAGSNHDPDGDSNGTTIVVSQP
jgi:hypothetical protein